MVISIISIAVPPALADTICKERTDGCDVVEINDPQTLRDLLDALGIPQCAEVDIPSAQCNLDSSEDISQAFEVKADPPEDFETEAEIEFEVVQDTGNFFYSYGFCHTDSVGILDPVTQKEAWATACLGDPDTVEIFDDTFDDVGDTKILLFDAGDELFFWVIPNNDLATFNADPSAFYPPQTTNNPFRAPLFSVENANPGEFDQVLTFIGGGKTLLTFEELSRTGDSDEDFIDLAFVLDVELTPTPKPITFDLEMEVTDITGDGEGLLEGIVGTGDLIHGTYTFDPEALDLDPTSEFGLYDVDAYSLHLDSVVYENVPPFSPGFDSIFVANDFFGFDEYGAEAVNLEQQSGPALLEFGVFFFFLDDTDQNVFDDDSLPLEPPDLNEFEDNFAALFLSDFDLFEDGNDVSPQQLRSQLETLQTVIQINGIITSLELQPTPPPPQPPIVGGEFLVTDSTALLLAGAQSFSWMIPVVLSVLGIGLFVVSRKSE